LIDTPLAMMPALFSPPLMPTDYAIISLIIDA
jgi:hypothetical protein